MGPPMVLVEGGPKNFQLTSSWHRRRQAKLWLSASNIGRGGGGVGGGGLLLRCTAVLIHPCWLPCVALGYVAEVLGSCWLQV